MEYICDRIAIIKNGRLVVYDRMEAIRASLGKREYQVVFKANEKLDYEQQDGSYVFRTSQVDEIATLLKTVSSNNWALVNLSVSESALEEIYVKLMTN